MRRRTTGNVTVATTLAVRVSNTEGTSVHVAAELTYVPDDPYAVTLTFHDPSGPIPWTFARDLLAEGIYEPIGQGDVHVWPCLSVTGEAVVMVELGSLEHGVVVEASTRAVSAFVSETLASVPRGSESLRYDVDAALAGILA